MESSRPPVASLVQQETEMNAIGHKKLYEHSQNFDEQLIFTTLVARAIRDKHAVQNIPVVTLQNNHAKKYIRASLLTNCAARMEDLIVCLCHSASV